MVIWLNRLVKSGDLIIYLWAKLGSEFEWGHLILVEIRILDHHDCLRSQVWVLYHVTKLSNVTRFNNFLEILLICWCQKLLVWILDLCPKELFGHNTSRSCHLVHHIILNLYISQIMVIFGILKFNIFFLCLLIWNSWLTYGVCCANFLLIYLIAFEFVRCFILITYNSTVFPIWLLLGCQNLLI